MPNNFILLSLLLITTLTLTPRTTSHLQSQNHFLDGELCKKSGGFVCGFVKKDCCAKGCDSKYFGMNEECVQGKVLDLSAAPDCKELCTKNNGTIFKSDLLADDQCCKKDDLKGNKCPAASIIDISKCGKGTLATKIVGFISHHMQN